MQQTQDRVGTGRAHVWLWSEQVNFTRYLGIPGPENLPAGYYLNISMRRAYRTGASAGRPIEDLDVPGQFIHNLIKRDLPEQNDDLLAFVASKIA